MATAMGFAHVGFLVLLCLSFCSARRVLTDSTDVEKPNFAPSNFQATQSTGGISSLGDSKWQSGGKGNHGSGGGGGGGGNCGGNEDCGGCGNFGGGGGGGGGYCGGCVNFGCGGGFGDGYCGGNGGCGCGNTCGGGGNYQGGCYYPPPPTCCPVSCPPVSNCCPVGCSSGYGQHKVAAQRWANWQAPPKPQVRSHHWENSQVPPSPELAHSQVPPSPQDSHDEHKTYVKKTENDEIHSEPKLNADNDSKPSHSDKETQLEQMTELDGKNQAEQPGSDGQMQEDVSKN